MWLLFLVEATIISYTRIRNQLCGPGHVSEIAEQERAVTPLTEAEEFKTLLPNLVASDFPLVRWLRQHVLELHGLDITQPTRMVTGLVLEG